MYILNAENDLLTIEKRHVKCDERLLLWVYAHILIFLYRFTAIRKASGLSSSFYVCCIVYPYSFIVLICVFIYEMNPNVGVKVNFQCYAYNNLHFHFTYTVAYQIEDSMKATSHAISVIWISNKNPQSSFQQLRGEILKGYNVRSLQVLDLHHFNLKGACGKVVRPELVIPNTMND